MVVAYWLVSVSAVLLIAVSHFRRTGLNSIPAWFIVLSVALVNIGFFLAHLQYGADGSHWSADGVVVTTTGLLTFGVVSFFIAGGPRKRAPTADMRTGTVAQLYLLSIVILGPAWLYFYLLGSVPLFDGVLAVLRSGLDGLGQLQASRLARDPYASQYGQRIPLQGLLQIFRTIGAPMLVAYAYLELQRGAARRPRIAVIVIAVITCLAAGQRWPLIYLGVAMAIALGMSDQRLPRRNLLSLTFGVMGVGVVISAMQARTLTSLTSILDAISFAVIDLLERIFLDQVYVPVLSYGPAGDEFRGLLGETYLQSLAAYVPGPGVSFSVDFYRGVTGDSTGYTAAPDFYTEAFINFGLVGVVLLSAAWAAILSGISRFAMASTTTGKMSIWLIVGAMAALSCYSGIAFTLGVLFVVATAWLALMLSAPRRADRLNHSTTVGKRS